MNNNIVKPNIQEQVQTRTLQNSYIDHTSISNRLNDRTPFDGMLDRFGEVRLRLAIIDNPEIKREQYSSINPIDPTNIINLNTGNIALKWVDMPGGVLRDKETMGGEYVYKPENDKTNPEDRDFSDWEISSRREMVSLTHPLIWQDSMNYCGLNYIPPVGSMVVVGFRKHGYPIILGYIPTHYNVCKPVLKPGEMVMKGYGNNYAHWRWSDKLDFRAWSEKGKIDNDDPNNEKVNATNCSLWLRMNANDRYIKISAFENDEFDETKSHSTEVKIQPASITMSSTEIIEGGGSTTQYLQTESSVNILAGDSNVDINGNSVSINTGSFLINATNIELNGSSVTTNADSISSNAGTISSISSGDNIIQGSTIQLN